VAEVPGEEEWECPNGHVYLATDAASFDRRRGELQCPECSGTPLERGPIYGSIYCAVGVGLGVLAWLTDGVVRILLAALGGLAFIAGAWTILFTGGILLGLRSAERHPGDTDRPKP
jgi:hypothetical protein